MRFLRQRVLCQLIADVNEWINQVPTVFACHSVKLHEWVRSLDFQRGKKTLMSLAAFSFSIKKVRV